MDSVWEKNESICCLKSGPPFIFSRSKSARNFFSLWPWRASLSWRRRAEASRSENVELAGGCAGAFCATARQAASAIAASTIASRSLFATFAAFRTVEDHPDQKIISKILKAMDLAGSGKKRVAGRELKAL